MEEQAHQTKYEQRLLELSLLEVLGDDAPPDLVDETMAEYEARKLGNGAVVSIETARRGRRVSAAGIALFAGGAIAASLVIAIGLYAFGDESKNVPSRDGGLLIEGAPTNAPVGLSVGDEPKDDLPPIEDDPVELQRQALLSHVSKQLIGVSGSSWELNIDNQVLLKQGWFLAQADSPTLSIGKTTITPVDGAVLIYAGPEFPKEAAIEDAIRQFDVLGYPVQTCQFRPVGKRESWFSNKDCSAYLLSGSVVC
ncbi:MAG: hypothetical protein L6Q71_08895, partial [Planctomycetes bacterium]|nr:hypothetical protein [Planctomycetota bacterium]